MCFFLNVNNNNRQQKRTWFSYYDRPWLLLHFIQTEFVYCLFVFREICISWLKSWEFGQINIYKLNNWSNLYGITDFFSKKQSKALSWNMKNVKLKPDLNQSIFKEKLDNFVCPNFFFVKFLLSQLNFFKIFFLDIFFLFKCIFVNNLSWSLKKL